MQSKCDPKGFNLSWSNWFCFFWSESNSKSRSAHVFFTQKLICAFLVSDILASKVVQKRSERIQDTFLSFSTPKQRLGQRSMFFEWCLSLCVCLYQITWRCLSSFDYGHTDLETNPLKHDHRPEAMTFTIAWLAIKTTNFNLFCFYKANFDSVSTIQSFWQDDPFSASCLLRSRLFEVLEELSMPKSWQN